MKIYPNILVGLKFKREDHNAIYTLGKMVDGGNYEIYYERCDEDNSFLRRGKCSDVTSVQDLYTRFESGFWIRL